MMYSEHRPPPELAPLVECFWTIRSPEPLGSPVRDRVLPDGCMDFIFDLGDLPAGRAPAHVVGTMPTALVVAHVGRVDLLGVRFRPGGATPLTRTPANELTGRILPLGDLLSGGASLAERLRDAGGPGGAEGAARTAARLAVITEALSSRLRVSNRTPEARVRAAATVIGQRAGRVSIAALARHVELGRRQLERVFAREVGCSPQEACAVARFRHAVSGMRRAPDVPLARIAVRAGYYDQPHMTREFRRLAGIPPAALRRERGVASVQDAGPALS